MEKSKAVLPASRTVFELLGLVVLATGVFCGLALFTYDPTDPTQIVTSGDVYRNMGGPAGAWLADALLGAIGIVSLLIAPVLFLFGLAVALGFIRWPKIKRFVGFGAVLVVCSGLVHIEHRDLGMTRLPSGLGGVIGTFLGDTLMRTIGYGGAVIGLSLAGIASLVITRNLTVSGTAQFLEYLIFVLGRIASQPTGRESRRAASPLTAEAAAATNGENGR